MSFTRFRYVEVPVPQVCYRSGLTNYNEMLVDGRWVGQYWNSAGYLDRENYAAEIFKVPQVPFHAFELEIDGQSLHFGWKFLGFTEVEPDRYSVVELESEIRPVRVRIHTRLDGTAVLTRWLEIVNLSDKPAALSKLAPWSGLLTRTAGWKELMPAGNEDVFTLGFFAENLAGAEGSFQMIPLPPGRYGIESLAGRSGHGSPFFVLKNQISGLIFIGSLAWSGNWKIEFKYEKDFTGADAWVAFSAMPYAPGPMRVLAPGETLVSPRMHLGCLHEDLDTAVQAMHDHIRRSVMPPQPKGRDFRVVYNHWGYTEAELSEESLFHEIDVAADIGAELFIVDAGWYADKNTNWWQTVGDWKEGDRLPHGLRAIREYAGKKGLLFGLWGEIERAGVESRLAREHPDWFLKQYGKTFSTALDLTHPEVARYVELTIHRLVEEHKLDLFRLDYNIRVGEGGQKSREGFMENTLYRHYEVLYGIFDRLRAKFPNLLLENCASGGGRTDLGLVSRFHHTWVSDCQVAPRSVRIFNGMSLALPPEYIDRNCGVGQDGHLFGDLGFQIRTCMLGHFTLTGFYPTARDYNPVQMDFVRHCVSLYKEFIRPMLPESRIFHHTPVLPGRDPKEWCVIELAAGNTERAVGAVFRMAGPATAETRIHFRGLNPGLTYKVTFDNSGYTATTAGLELIQKGLTVRLDHAITSELILLEALT